MGENRQPISDTQSDISMRAAVDFALAGIRGMYLLNGGAVIAILTFMGNVKMFSSTQIALANSIIWFVLGLISVMVCTVFSYLGQNQITKGAPAGEGWLTNTAIAMGALSIVFFGAGALIAAAGLK